MDSAQLSPLDVFSLCGVVSENSTDRLLGGNFGHVVT